MFSGIGGFELGIIKSFQRRECKTSYATNDMPMPRGGDEWWWRDCEQTMCIGFSEIDKYAKQVYLKHFPNHKDYGDATKIRTDELPYFDLLVGGFPCQAFSVAGKRQGFQDTRGTMFFEIARILSDKRPRHFLLENVKGLLSHDNGKTFQTILKILTDLGYVVEWQVLNSKNFGVPQNRERVFIRGHLGIRGFREIFPIGESNTKHIQENSQRNAYCLQAGNDKHRGTYIRTDKQDSRPKGNKSNSSNSIRRTSYTNGMRIRRLTPTECARLQGFPDDWCADLSDTQAYKCYGNAVTTNVVEAIMNKLIAGIEL